MGVDGAAFFRQARRASRQRIDRIAGKSDGRAYPELFNARFSGGLEVRMPRPPGVEVDMESRRVSPASPRTSACPICLVAPATSDDHVPPQSVGGALLVRTCERCNNEFGSRYEVDFADWYDVAIRAPRFSGDTVRGARHAGRHLVRETPSGEFVLFGVGAGDPATEEILEAGQFSMHGFNQDPARVLVAAGKIAFLLLCALLDGEALSPRGEALRGELLAARELPRRAPVEVGPTIRRIRLG